MTTSDATPESWDQLDEIEDDSPAEPVEEGEVEEEAEVEAEAPEAEAETEAPEAETDPQADPDAGAAEAASAETETPSVEAEDAVEGGPTETPDAPEDIAPSPFTFRAHGQEYTIKGAEVVEEDGQRKIVMTEEAWQEQIHPRIQDPSSWERTRQKLERQLAERDPERNEKVVWARTIMETLDPLFEKAEKGDSNALLDWIDNVTQNSAVLRARAEAAVAKAQAEPLQREREAEEQNRNWEETAPVLRDGLRQHAAAVLDSEEFKGLGLKADDELVDTLWELWEQGAPVFTELTEETAPQYGLKPGLYVNKTYVATHLRPTARAIKAERQRRKAAADAEKTNRKALGGGKKAPAAVEGKGSPTPEKDEGEPSSKEEWIESLR